MPCRGWPAELDRRRRPLLRCKRSPAALLGGDMLRVLAVVQQGLASAEHAAFMQRLQTLRPSP
jgi:hypothetical protein